MLKAVRERLTFSNVVSVIALFVAMGGTAIATLDRNSVGPRQLKANAVITGKIRNGAVTTPKIRAGAVTGAKIKESTLGRVPSAESATTAAPFAYARVGLNGVIYPAFSKNIVQANVTHPSPGLYCFDLPFAVKSGQATAQADAEPDDIASLEIAGGIYQRVPSECPANNEVEVFTFDTEVSPGLQDAEFYIELNR